VALNSENPLFDARPDESGSSRTFIATAALAVGLLTGFAGGYVTGHRNDARVSPAPARPVGNTQAPPPERDEPAQSYTETPVADPPAPVATAEVSAPPVPRASTSRPAAPGGTGALFVFSRPPGAQVFLDERLVGATPLNLSDVAAGAHRVRIALADHQRWETTVRIAPGVSERVAASLER
jgi:hypothetical protein